MVFGLGKRTTMPSPQEALPGRSERPYAVNPTHVVLGTPLEGPWPDGSQVLYVGMGCFWGAERIFWQQPGVISTAVGYMGGLTPNPTYEETCTGLTGHAEMVRVVYDPTKTSTQQLLRAFWENHDPTTPNRQGNDIGTAYRSIIVTTTPEQAAAAEATRAAYQRALHEAGHGEISTQIIPADEAGPFYLAEDYHQGYLHKNPGGYCNHGFNGVSCPVGVLRQDELPAQQDVAPPH